MIWLSLFACPGGDTDPAETSTTDAPDVAQGEVAIDLSLDGETFEVRCADESVGYAGLIPDMAQDVDMFGVNCTGSANDPKRIFTLTVRDPAVAVGTFPLAWTSGLDTDQSTSAITDADANGYAIYLDGDGGTQLTGSLTIAEMGTAGERVRGTFDFTWEMTGIIEGGGVVRYDALPGRASGAFDVALK